MFKITNHTKIMLTSKSTGRSTTVLDTQAGVVGQVVAGIPITECVDNSLDSLVLTVKVVEKKVYEPFDVVTLTVTDEDGETAHDMVVATDNITSYQRHLNNYSRTVQLAEQTKILEKTKIHNLNLTNKNDTLLRQFEKALNNAELLVSGESYEDVSRFEISDKLRTLLIGLPSEDFWFGNTDLRTVLDTMLMACNCRVIVERIEFNAGGDIYKIVIGYRALNAASAIAPQWTRDRHGVIVNEEQEVNCQDYAGKICASGKNTIISGEITITDTFKSSQASLSNTTACIILPFAISDKGISSFVIKDFNIKHGSSVTHFDSLDLSNRLLVKETYDLLSETDAQNYVPYQIGSNIIEVGTYCNKYLVLQKGRMPEIIKEETGFTGGSSNVIDNWFDLVFTCTYYPQINTTVEITKPNTYDPDTLRMGIMSSQTENTLDVARHGRQLLALARRTGNAAWYIDVEASHYRRLLPLMAKIDDDYVVYKREVQVFDNLVKCRYYLSKNFNAIEAKAGVKREKHLYDIPLESDECPLLVKQYMVFSKTAPTSGIDKTLKTGIITSALQSLIALTGESINFLMLKTHSGDEVYPQNTENSTNETPYSDPKYVFARPLLRYGQAKSMNFVASLLDNYSVDYSRDGYVFSLWGDGGHRMTYNRYVSKADATVGECDKFELDFALGCNFLDSPDKYENYDALVKGFPVADGGEFVKCTNQPFRLKYHKDRTQKPGFILSLECVPSKEDFGNIVIGTRFCKRNFLVGSNNIFVLSTIHVRVSATEYIDDDVDTVLSDAYTDIGQASQFFDVEENDGYATLKYKGGYAGAAPRSWVITDAFSRELYLGANGDLCDLHVHLAQWPRWAYEGAFAVIFSSNDVKVLQKTHGVVLHKIQFVDDAVFDLQRTQGESLNAVTFENKHIAPSADVGQALFAVTFSENYLTKISEKIDVNLLS